MESGVVQRSSLSRAAHESRYQRVGKAVAGKALTSKSTMVSEESDAFIGSRARSGLLTNFLSFLERRESPAFGKMGKNQSKLSSEDLADLQKNTYCKKLRIRAV